MTEEKIAARLETALEGARLVTTNTRGWSTVSRLQIESMAVIIALLFDHKEEDADGVSEVVAGDSPESN